MLVVRGKLENRQAIIQIGFQRFVPSAQAVQPDQFPVLIPIQAYRALLDTGAQRTCLGRRIIAQERLARHGKRFIQNVHNQAVHSLFWAQIGFWANGTREHVDETKTYFALPHPTEVIDIADNDSFDAIVGMDVMQKFDVLFERSGHFEIRLT